MAERQVISVGVMGAGSVGCFVGGLLAHQPGVHVTLVGRQRLFDAITAEGLTTLDLDGQRARLDAEQLTLALTPDALATCDVVLICTKSGQTAAVAEQLASVLRADAVVVSLQNGVRNPETLRTQLSQPVLAGIVEFNVRWSGPATFERTTNGPLVIERSDAPAFVRTAEALKASGLALDTPADVTAAQWTKLLVNLNNAINALSGAPTPTLVTTDYRFVIAALVEEGVRVLRAAGVRVGRFRGLPISWMPKLLRLPEALVKRLMAAQLKANATARSSMWEDLDRRRKTEVNYLNGEIVRLAEQAGTTAPLNAGIVALIREAEEAGEGSPQLSPAALSARLQRR